GNGRIAVAGIDIAVVLAGKAGRRRLAVRIDEPRGQVECLGGFAEMRAVEAATHQLGGVAALGCDLRSHVHPCTHGKPARFQPPTVPRWPSRSRSPSKPCATL